MITREFTHAELGALGVPPGSPDDIDGDVILDDQKLYTLKYSQERAVVFRDADGDNRTYTVTYEAELDLGDFEVGGGAPENHGWTGDTVTAVEVEEVPIVVTAWRPVEAHYEDPEEQAADRTAVQRLVDLYEETGAHPEDAREWAAALLAQYAKEIGAELPCPHESWEITSEYEEDGQRWQSRRCADCKEHMHRLPVTSEPAPRPSFRDAAGRTGYEGDTVGGTTSGRYQATILGPVIKLGKDRVKVRCTTGSAGSLRPGPGDEVWISHDRVFLVQPATP
ncbi:hypothetical protein [Streptomyces sp. NRRL S-350]|uniref:hypothetical protein n=1 Tax=Streptomyces sp. NRRL S-350 TaxID=1463902 RepID=UPI0004C0BCEC|nr:hypothetical protein [Streptomyces sp. NRRL S-350]